MQTHTLIAMNILLLLTRYWLTERERRKREREREREYKKLKIKSQKGAMSNCSVVMVVILSPALCGTE